MARENAREFGAEGLGGRGLFAVEEEGRFELAFAVAGDTDDGAGGGVVAGTFIVDRVFVAAGIDFHAAKDAGAAEEGGGFPELFALAGGEVEVDLFEMVGSIVAGDAGEIDAHEVLDCGDGEFVGGVFVDGVFAG